MWTKKKSYIDIMWIQELSLKIKRCLIVRLSSKREKIYGHVYLGVRWRLHIIRKLRYEKESSLIKITL